MRKGFLAICSILLVLVVLIALLVPSCTQPPGTGFINVVAKVCGVTEQAHLNYTLTPGSGSPISGTSVPSTHLGLLPGTWTCAYVSGAIPGAFFTGIITPSATQNLSAGGSIDFLLDFELNEDAAIKWLTWTVNGNSFNGSGLETVPCNIIDAHFKQWVNGCEGYNVTLNETSWLSITQTAGSPATVVVVNDLCAVNKTAFLPAFSPVKKSQVTTVGNVTREKGYNVTLVLKQPTLLDVHTQWQLLKCVNYTKAINWFGISLVNIEPGAHPCVLFELVLPMPGQFYQFTLQPSADVALVGATDVNPADNHAMGPSLTLTVDLT